MSALRINTACDQETLQALLSQQQEIEAQQQEIQAQINSILTSNTTSAAASTFQHQHHRSPIHKQNPHRRNSNVPRSISNQGIPMGRQLSSDRIEAPSRSRTLSQRSEPTMMRSNSSGIPSNRTGKLPFTHNGSTMPPLFQAESNSGNGNPAMEAWVGQDQPLSSYTFSHQQPPMHRSISQRQFNLPQVQELEHVQGDNPGDFLHRNGIPQVVGPSSLSISPSLAKPSYNQQRLSPTSRHSFNAQTPDTPSTTTLTDSTTHTSNMSRTNSLFSDHLLESIEMMKFDSRTSYSTDINKMDDTSYHAASPYTSSHHHARRSSHDEQAKLLVGAGGASHDSPFSHSFPTPEVLAQSQFSAASFGEKMEKSQSESSTSSSTSSRSKQRLQVSNMAAARPLMPKGGFEDGAMSRVNSSQSMARLESKDGSQDKIAISSKTAYQRPKHERVFCKLCDEHQEGDGFRGEHELRRHTDRQHKSMVKKFVCIEPTGQGHPKPMLPLSKCKSCIQQKKYGAYYNAAAHLRRAHFKPKSKAKGKTLKVDDTQKRGGKAGGDWPHMQELKYWMKEVEEPAAPDYPSTTSEQEMEEDDEDFDDNVLDDLSTSHGMGGSAGGNFDSPYPSSNTSTMFDIYNSPNQQFFGIQGLGIETPPQQNIDLSMAFNTSQTSFDSSFSQFSNTNDPSASFFEPSPVPPQLFDDQFIGADFVHLPYDSSLSFP